MIPYLSSKLGITACPEDQIPAMASLSNLIVKESKVKSDDKLNRQVREA